MSPRPRVTVFLALSLDGCIAGPDGDLSFLNPYMGDSPAETGYEALMASADTLVIGRATYDTVLGFGGDWPYAGKRVVVLTHRELTPRHGERPFAGSLVELLATLWAEGARHVYADGGQVARQALAAGVVDELTLTIVPEVLGTGVALWGPELPRASWRLAGTKAFASGLVQVSYAPSR